VRVIGGKHVSEPEVATVKCNHIKAKVVVQGQFELVEATKTASKL